MKGLVRWRLALDSLVALIALGVVKAAMHALGLEYLELNTLFSSVIGGAVFVFGLILAGTLSDLKESKRIMAAIRRTLLRVYYIQKIDFLPSAYNFVRTLVVLIVGLLLFTSIEPI